MASQLSSELLQCVICLGDLENPHALPCLHSFCETCLQNHILSSQKKISKTSKMKKFPCPTCRIWISSPISGVNEFPKDFRVEKLKDALAFSKSSEICSSPDYQACGICSVKLNSSVQKYCVDCKKYFCVDCCTTHNDTPVLTSHIMMSLFENEEYDNLKCNIHSDEPIKYQCETCNRGVCLKCIMGQHKSHIVVSLEASGFVKRADLQNCMHHINEQLSLLNDILYNLASIEDKVKSQHEETKSQIRKHSNKVIRNVQYEENQLLNETEKELQCTSEDIFQRQEKCRLYMQQFRKLQSRLQSILTVQDINSVLSSYNDIILDIQKIEITENYQRHLLDIPVCAQFVSENLPKFGKIVSGSISAKDTYTFSNHQRSPGSDKDATESVCTANTSDGSSSSSLTSPVHGICQRNNKHIGQKSSITVAELLSQIGGHSSTLQLSLPYGVTFIGDNLAVAENGNSRLQIFTKEGNSLKVISLTKCSPRCISTMPDQNIAMTDENQKCMKILNTENCQLSSITVKRNTTCVSFPFGIACLQDGAFVISDMIYESVSIVSTSGEEEIQLGHDQCGESFDNPSYLATDIERNIFVSDSGHHEIKAFDRKGRFLFKFGEFGSQAAQLRYPKGIAVDKNGQIFVADSGNDRVLIFSRLGFYLGVLLDGSHGITRPVGLAYSPSGLLAVSMPDIHQVSIYQLQTPSSTFQRIYTY